MKYRPYSRLSWMDAATRGIRFGTDRDAVRQELTEHLEDKIADLKRFYPEMSDRETEQRALAQMGDAEEIGREMARIHKPWLGYLWRFSQAILLVVVLMFAVGLREHAENYWFEQLKSDWQCSREFQIIEGVLYGSNPTTDLEGTYSYREDWSDRERLALYPKLNQEQRLGKATVTLSQAALWRETEDKHSLYAQVNIAYDKPWEKSKLLSTYLQVEDSLGNHYGYELILRENGATQKGMGALGWKRHWDGYTWNFVVSELPENAEWVCFTYGLRPNADFSFVIDLTGEVEK